MEDLASLRVGLKKRRPVGPSGPRIFLTGSTLAVGDYKVVDLIEENGASLVIEEFSEGMRDYWQEIGGEDIPLRSIAKAYFLEKTPPAFFRGVMKERFQALLSFVKDFQVDGVVWYSLMYRECYDIEGYFFRDPLEKIGIPLLKISSEYDASEAGALRTRLETFVEGLRKR
jgi:benzoyl-CoA reductase/2-hydroxyglutaryl-CoA dehydratase subunit BcrC/BadD/HgdB